MSLVLTHAMKKPVIRVGRMAGQYAKPRSADTETRDGVTLPATAATSSTARVHAPSDREPDPTLLLRGYERAALTLNFVRALIDGGFADLHHPEYWDLGLRRHSPFKAAYERIVALDRRRPRVLRDAISRHEVHQALRRVDFYTSHEGLVLHYEQAQTRFIRAATAGTTSRPTCRGSACAPRSSTARTSSTSAASPTRWASRSVRRWTRSGCSSCHDAEPENVPGRITLIHRFGAKEVEAGCRS
jgi:3-deoxy-7-phosphoheptulonate synthase